MHTIKNDLCSSINKEYYANIFFTILQKYYNYTNMTEILI